MMEIIAIDAGFAATGCVRLSVSKGAAPVVLGAAVLRYKEPAHKKTLRSSDLLVDRVEWLFRELVQFVGQAKIMVVEMPSGGAKSAIAMRAMGMAMAVIACVHEATGVAAVWVAPRDSKLAACGDPAASKQAVQAAMLAAYPGLAAVLPRRGSKVVQGDAEHIVDAMAAWHTVRRHDLFRLS